VSSTQRPILPQSALPFSPSKFLCSLSPKKPRRKKASAQVDAKSLPAIAPKAVVAKYYLSPVKQVAASITARAKRLQNSPSRGVWYAVARLRTAESPSCSVRLATGVVVDSPDARTPADVDEEEALSGGDGEEQGTDVESQLEEDEIDDDSSAVVAEQSPSSYVRLFLSLNILNLNRHV